MKANDIRKNAALVTILFFGGLSGMGGYIVNMHPDLMDTWEGLAMIGAPAVLGFIFLIISMRWKLDGSEQPATENAVPDTQERKEKEPANGLSENLSGPEDAAPGTAAAHDSGITVVQILGLLQREGRLIDFLQEDISPYSDDQIGAAVREVHKGCREAIMESFRLAPVLDAEEGSEIEVDEDFDPMHIKLVGNVQGKPPFRGVLRHCGWRYTEINLPEWSTGRKTDVISPAEVEVS